jgi:hypothetical protein
MKTYSITVGIGEDRNGSPIGEQEHKAALEEAGRFLLNQPGIGGYTRQDSFGGWINDHGDLVEEPGLVFTVAVTLDSQPRGVRLNGQSVDHIHTLGKMKAVADGLRSLWNQACVCLECHQTGEFFIVADDSE